MPAITSSRKCVFIGGPYDGKSIAIANPGTPVFFMYGPTELVPREPDMRKWPYECHFFVIGNATVPVYVVSGLNLDAAAGMFLALINSRT